MRARHFGFWSLNACRIVYTIDEEGPVVRFGFAYGTLPDHAEQGEERFSVEWHHEDGTVWYDILAFSRPNHPLASLRQAVRPPSPEALRPRLDAGDGPRRRRAVACAPPKGDDPIGPHPLMPLAYDPAEEHPLLAAFGLAAGPHAPASLAVDAEDEMLIQYLNLGGGNRGQALVLYFDSGRRIWATLSALLALALPDLADPPGTSASSTSPAATAG